MGRNSITDLASLAPKGFVGLVLFGFFDSFGRAFRSHFLSQFFEPLLLLFFSQRFDLDHIMKYLEPPTWLHDFNSHLLSRFLELIVATLFRVEVSKGSVFEDFTTFRTFDALSGW